MKLAKYVKIEFKIISIKILVKCSTRDILHKMNDPDSA